MTEQNDALAMAMEDVAGGVTEVGDDKLRTVSKHANHQLFLQSRIAMLDEQLKETQSELKRVSEIDLPNAMIEAGMKEFTLTDGSKVSIKKVYIAGLKDDNKPAAFKWLVEHGHEALIKVDVTVPFGKGDYEHAVALQAAIDEALKQLGLNDKEAMLEQSIHWQTLRAFVKEQVEREEKLINEGEIELAHKDAIPRDLLGVFIIDKADVKAAKG